MTFEQIFSGRMVLMRAQHHIAQAGLIGVPNIRWMNPRFVSEAHERAFFIVERLLCELEREFDDKRKRCHLKKRHELADRADRQVIESVVKTRGAETPREREK